MRPQVKGTFPFEGFGFGYTYWEPMSPNAGGGFEKLSCVAGSRESSSDVSGSQPPNTPAAVVSPSDSPLATLPGYRDSIPLVLVHGFGQSAQSWEPVVKALSPVRPVWAFELMGHGISDRPVQDRAYELEFQGRALLTFLEAVAGGVDSANPRVVESVSSVHVGPSSDSALGSDPFEKLTLIGYSMGGRVVLSSMAETQRFAQVVANVVLESAGLGAPSLDVREEAARKDAFHAQKLREEGVEAFFDYWETLPLFASQQALPPGVRQAIREERLRNDAQALAFTFENAGQHCMPLREEVYGRLLDALLCGVEVTYLVGEKDAKYVALADRAAQEIGLSVVKVPGCGHNIHGEAGSCG